MNPFPLLPRQIELLLAAKDIRTTSLTRVLSMCVGGDDTEAKIEIENVPPSDLAYSLMQMDSEGQKWFFDFFDPEIVGSVLAELNEPVRERLTNEILPNRLKSIVENMDVDEATDVVATLGEDVREDFINILDKETKSEILHLLTYEEESAGGIMTTDFVTVRSFDTVDKAIQIIRKYSLKNELENIYNAFVVDSTGHLLGKVSANKLLITDGRKKIESLIETTHSVPLDMDQEQVAQVARDYNELAVPVVDNNNILVGRITIDDLMDVVNEEASEDLSIIAGTKEEGIGDITTISSVKQRIPWLITGLLGGGFAALLMHSFSVALEKVVAISFFVPLIMSMGGNSGIQASSIVVRTFTLNKDSVDIVKNSFRELRIAFINGLILGTILFIFVFLFFYITKVSQDSFTPLRLALTVGCSLQLVIIISAIMGSAIPYWLHKFKIDPTVAMGPFITIANDIISLTIYLSISKILLF